jgi:hypothetical protein
MTRDRWEQAGPARIARAGAFVGAVGPVLRRFHERDEMARQRRPL